MVVAERPSATERSPRRVLARVVTEVFAPATVASLLLVVVAWHSAPGTPAALGWAVVGVLFAGLIPMAYIIRGVRRRRLTDHHVGLRQQRILPLLVGILSVLLGIGLLLLAQAPHELVALVAAMGVGLGSSLLVTLAWKLSIHVAVVAGAVVIVALVFGPVALGLVPLVVLVGWARVALQDHTPAQALAGAALGSLVAASVFSRLR